MSAPDTLRKTALNALHRRLGAKMVDFGGWDMPVQYRGVIDEHLAVRNAAGLFDVSHMGEVEVRGPGALAFIQDSARKTVGIGVTTELIRGDVFFWGALMGGALIAAIPVAILYTAFLDRIIKGFSLGATA